MDPSQNSSVVSGGNGAVLPQNSTDTSASDDPKQNLSHVINSIQKTLGLIHQLYLTVSSFNVSSQLPLLHRLNALVLELDNMTKLAEKCNIQVPMQVLNLIDDGKNPDEFTREILNGCIAKNQVTKGKTDAFKINRYQALCLHIYEYSCYYDTDHSLRGNLIEELEQAFPDEVESYRQIRAASAAESKRLAQAQSILPNGDVKVKPEL